MTEMGRSDVSAARSALGWCPAIAFMLFGAMISQDIEGHYVAGTVLLGAAALLIFGAWRLDRRLARRA